MHDLCVLTNFTYALDNNSNIMVLDPDTYLPKEHFDHLKHLIDYFIAHAFITVVLDRVEPLLTAETIDCYRRKDVPYRRDMLIIEAIELVAQMIKDEQPSSVRHVQVGTANYTFTEAQDFLIAKELYCCAGGGGPKGIPDQTLLIESTFGCSFEELEEKCRFFDAEVSGTPSNILLFSFSCVFLFIFTHWL
uniref:Phosphotransferase n=1 Tax=Steinernema glaseri TaxID=37863 RepID=A0A1I7YE10_9BILA